MAEEDVSANTQNCFPACQRAYVNSQPLLNEWTNHSAFYALYPSYYFTFAQQWLRRWLQWFDGYVPSIHDGESGILSTRLATTLCYRLAEQVFGGGLLFSSNAKFDDSDKALKFISGDFKENVALDECIQKCFVLAAAGGTSYLKTNHDNAKEIWVDAWRADQCYADFDFKGNVNRAKFIVAKYTQTVPNERAQNKQFCLIEERFYANPIDNKEYQRTFAKKINGWLMPQSLELGKPYVRYSVHVLEGQVNNEWVDLGRGLGWEELPDNIKRAIIDAYGTIKINEPNRLPFLDLGIDAFKWTSFISNLPQLPYGESVVAKIQSYLFEYDFMNSSMNTDFYLGRGRVLVPKAIQNPQNRNRGGWNEGLDNFLFTKIDSQTVEGQKPMPVQFELRSQEWLNSRNNLLECIATAIGISPSTIASYLNDASARTAREISSEESATALFVENRRKLFTKPINDLIKRVLLYHGYKDSVVVKFSKSGQTNTTLVTENTVSAVNNGLMSQYQGVKNINPDMSEQEIEQEIGRIKAEQAEKAKMQNDMFGGGGFDDNVGGFIGGGEPTQSEGIDGYENNDSETAKPELAGDNN